MTKDKLCELRLGGTDECIPTFEQVLQTINGAVPMLIEIKNEGKIGKLEQKVIDMLASYNGEFAVESFNPYSMEYFKKNATGIIRGTAVHGHDQKDAARRIQEIYVQLNAHTQNI